VEFSGVSMANTIADGETKEIQTNPCKSTFEYYFNQSLSAGYSEDQAWAWASLNYDMCANNISWIDFTP
jgi:hypothetical protein